MIYHCKTCGRNIQLNGMCRLCDMRRTFKVGDRVKVKSEYVNNDSILGSDALNGPNLYTVAATLDHRDRQGNIITQEIRVEELNSSFWRQSARFDLVEAVP